MRQTIKKSLFIWFIHSLIATNALNAEQLKNLELNDNLKKLDPCSSSEALGVTRTLEIDTRGGPTIGTHLEKNTDLLADKEVILTFDDGPSRRYTETVLNALDEQCTKATFFVIGKSALLEPQILQDIDRRGHTIAAHTWSHKRLDKIGFKKSKYEIEMGFSAIERALGKAPTPLFRFPYLAESEDARKYLIERNFSNTRINIDSRDFLTRNPSVVKKNVMKQLKAEGKGIILFHDIQPSTASAIRSILKELKSNNYKVVHLAAKEPAATLLNYNTLAKREALLINGTKTDNNSVNTSYLEEEQKIEVQKLKANDDRQALSKGKASKNQTLVQEPKTPQKKYDDSWAVNPLRLPRN